MRLHPAARSMTWGGLMTVVVLGFTAAAGHCQNAAAGSGSKPTDWISVIVAALALLLSLVIGYATWWRRPDLRISPGPDIFISNNPGGDPDARLLLTLDNQGAQNSTVTVMQCQLRISRRSPRSEATLVWFRDVDEGKRLYPLPVQGGRPRGLYASFALSESRTDERRREAAWYASLAAKVPGAKENITAAERLLQNTRELFVGEDKPIQPPAGPAGPAGPGAAPPPAPAAPPASPVVSGQSAAERRARRVFGAVSDLAAAIKQVDALQRSDFVFYAAGDYDVELLALDTKGKQWTGGKYTFAVDGATAEELIDDLGVAVRLDLRPRS